MNGIKPDVALDFLKYKFEQYHSEITAEDFDRLNVPKEYREVDDAIACSYTSLLHDH